MTTPTVDAILARTAVGNGWHDFAVEGGSVRVAAATLRRALEAAYDPAMPDWAATVSEDDLSDA
jgi:hypothetical protein